MKEKIKNALKTEYAKMGLGEKAFDGVASFLAKTITKDEDIDGVIKGEDTANLLKAFQGESDSLRTRNAQLAKDLEDYKKSHPDTDPSKGGKTEPDPNAEPEWAKKLREQNEAILKRQADEDAAKVLRETRDSIERKLKEGGCANAGILGLTLKGFSLKEKETEEDAVKRLTEEYNANVKAAFGEGVVPPAGGGSAAPDAKAAREAHNKYLRDRGLLPEEQKTT